jgi:hypothetical protein
MSISRVFVGDSNVRRFWASGLADRSEVAGKLDFRQAANTVELEAALSSITGKPKSVVISALTNPICDHVKSVSPQSISNLQHSVRTVLVEMLTGLIYPFCERLSSTKV